MHEIIKIAHIRCMLSHNIDIRFAYIMLVDRVSFGCFTKLYLCHLYGIHVIGIHISGIKYQLLESVDDLCIIYHVRLIRFDEAFRIRLLSHVENWIYVCKTNSLAFGVWGVYVLQRLFYSH